ncbi:MAG: hypothetical protein BACD_03519 [Bacteroides rodentium]
MSETSTTGAYVYQQIVKTTAQWAADTSIIPENVWLFERRTDGKIVTKLSDGLRPYNKLDEYGLSAWDAAQLGGYKGTKAEFYASLGKIDEKVETVQNLVASLDGKFAETPTLSAKPTENTLTYKSGEVTRSFSIGQQCRVYDTENKKYVFYQLYDITADNKADWQIAGSDGSAFSETAKITLSSNQGVGDMSLIGVVVTIKYSGSQTDLVWNGAELSATIPMSVEYQVICGSASGYLVPDEQTYLAIGGNKRQISLVYSTEKVTVNISTNDSADCSGRTVQVVNTANSQIVGSGKGSSVVIKVPFGISYKVKVDDFPGYLTPQEQIYTANSAARSASFQYEKIVDASIVFDKSISDPSNITGEVNSGVLATILSKFRRCLCKKTANGEVTISYLKDTDSNYYADGTSAKLDGTEGDVMVDFPEFYYKHEKIDTNKFRYRFAEYNVDGTFKHVPRSLVGAYKAYQTGSKLYSRSGVVPTTNTTYTNFASYATARGTGYQLIDFQQHCVIAFMLYAKYGNRNLQAVLGAGGATYNPATTTGTTNQKGNRDTAKETSGYVNGLGIEGVFGGQYEWTQGVSIQGRIWTITDPDGATRTVNAHTSDGWITGVAAEAGPFFDMVPTAVGGSETTHYSDYYYQTSGGPFCLLRSYNSSNTNGGVAYSNANNAASNSNTNIGSRLIFRKKIFVMWLLMGTCPRTFHREMHLASWQKINSQKCVW